MFCNGTVRTHFRILKKINIPISQITVKLSLSKSQSFPPFENGSSVTLSWLSSTWLSRSTWSVAENFSPSRAAIRTVWCRCPLYAKQLTDIRSATTQTRQGNWTYTIAKSISSLPQSFFKPSKTFPTPLITTFLIVWSLYGDRAYDPVLTYTRQWFFARGQYCSQELDILDSLRNLPLPPITVDEQSTENQW